MMFAIALGIDYALFIVVRFRVGARGRARTARGDGGHDGDRGQGGLVSGLTVIAALLAVTLVPVPAFRSVPLGIALAVTMVLAASLTLLPAALSRLGHRVNGGRVRMRGAIDHRSERFAAWGAGCGRGHSRTAPRPGDPAAPRRPGARVADRDADRRRAPGRCGLAPGSDAAGARVRRRRAERAPGRGRASGTRRPHGRCSSVTAASPRSRPRSARTAVCCSPPSRSRSGRTERDDRSRPRRAARRRAARRRRRRDPRPGTRARVAAADRRRRGARPRLRPAARAPAGAARSRPPPSR